MLPDTAEPRLHEVWSAILDFPSRVSEQRAIREVLIYGTRSEGNRTIRKAYWKLNVLGIDVGYGSIYECNRTRGLIEWRLDPTRADDLKFGRGRYLIRPTPGRPGLVRLTYDYEVLSHLSGGKRLRRHLAATNAGAMLKNIRRRAEL